MKAHTFSLLAATVFSALTAVSVAAEKNLVENGDFGSKRLKHWTLNVSSKYGYDLDHKIEKKAIHFKKVKGASPGYIILNQPIVIQKGKKYRLTFEAIIGTDTHGKSIVGIGRPGFARPLEKSKLYSHKSTQFKPTNEWTKFSYDFTGMYETDNKDLKKTGSQRQSLKKEWEEKEKDGAVDVAPTLISFSVGGITGDISLRNVVVEEVK